MNECELISSARAVSLKQAWMYFSPLGVKMGLSKQKATQIHINEPTKRIKNSLVSLTSTM